MLVSDPERGALARAMQSLKQSVSRTLALRAADPFWQARYHDFNVWSERRFVAPDFKWLQSARPDAQGSRLRRANGLPQFLSLCLAVLLPLEQLAHRVRHSPVQKLVSLGHRAIAQCHAFPDVLVRAW